MTDSAVAMADPDAANPYSSDPGFGDAVASEAAQNDFLRARAATLDDGLFKLSGGEAVAAAPAAVRKLEDMRDALVERVGNMRQQALLADDLDAHLALARDDIARHVAQQTKVWDQAVRAERIGLLQDQARRDWNDPDKLAPYGDAAASANDDDPDAARSSVWRSAIDAALTAGQHDAALDLGKDAEDHLTPDDGKALAPELAIAKQMQTGRDYVNGLLPQPRPVTLAATDTARQEALQRNAADWAQDAEQLATNRHLIDVQFGAHQRSLQQAEAQRAQAAQDWLARRDAQGNPQTERPPPSLWKQLDTVQRQQIDAQLAQNARGDKPYDLASLNRDDPMGLSGRKVFFPDMPSPKVPVPSPGQPPFFVPLPLIPPHPTPPEAPPPPPGHKIT